jgi:hypothetical protein
MIIVFYVALTVLAVSVRRKVFLCAATAIIFIVSGWYLKNSFSAGSIFILSGGESQEPVVAICPPGRRAAFVINSTSKHTARPLLNMFAIKGIDNIDTMLFCEARKESCAGSKYLLAGSNVSCVVLPARFRQSWFSRKTVEEACESGSEIKLIPDGTGIFRTGGLSFTSSEDGKGEKKCNICIFLPEKSLKLSISDTGLGVRTLEISRSDSNNIRMKLVNTDTPFIREFKF